MRRSQTDGQLSTRAYGLERRSRPPSLYDLESYQTNRMDAPKKFPQSLHVFAGRCRQYSVWILAAVLLLGLVAIITSQPSPNDGSLSSLESLGVPSSNHSSQAHSIEQAVGTADEEQRAVKHPFNEVAVVIDCGSSGSRVFVYGVRKRSEIEIEVIAPQKKIEPGLSSYASNPEEGFESLVPLLDYAVRQLPTKMASAPPLYILATAGMRSLPPADQAALLREIRKGLDAYEASKFHFGSDHVRVITGQEEGLYGWLAMNFALGRLSTTSSTGGDLPIRRQTGGIVEIGGSSAQVCTFLLWLALCITRVWFNACTLTSKAKLVFGFFFCCYPSMCFERVTNTD